MEPNQVPGRDRASEEVTVSRGSDNVREGGGFYQPISTYRRVKHYGISEDELESLGDLNDNVSLWRSITAGAFTLFLGCAWDMLSGDYGKAEIASIFVLVAVVGAAFQQQSSFASKKYKRLLAIKEQCMDVPPRD